MYLLDTCTLLWLTMEPGKLSAAARRAVSGKAGHLYISAVTGFEISQKVARGRLILPLPPSEWLNLAARLHGLKVVSLDLASAVAAGVLPALHADPFDRLLIATARSLRLTLLTPDPMIRQYPALDVFW